MTPTTGVNVDGHNDPSHDGGALPRPRGHDHRRTQRRLLAIAGYGTPQELAIAAIAVKHRGGRHVYRVADAGGWTASLEEVASAAVHVRIARLIVESDR